MKESLQELNKQIRNCRKCRLRKTRKNAVPGEGPANAKIMLIGQAPGAEEDKQGRPFVGRAGKFLNNILQSIDIKRHTIFITSPIRCFPPKNRKPKKDELEACKPYLNKNIEIIKPKIIVLMGEIAFNSFFPDKKLKFWRGKWLENKDKGMKGIKFIVTYHPAAAMRFPKIRKKFEKDFKRLKKGDRITRLLSKQSNMRTLS